MANNLIIGYDLKKLGQDYDAVINEIKSLGGWVHIQQSLFYVNSNFTAAQARDRLGKVTDGNDTIIVVDATNNSAAFKNIANSRDVIDRWNL